MNTTPGRGLKQIFGLKTGCERCRYEINWTTEFSFFKLNVFFNVRVLGHNRFPLNCHWP